jgi:hypothetical protein
MWFMYCGSRYNCVASSGCAIHFTAVFTAGGTCNNITGLAASPDPVNFLASANDYFAEDAFDTNHPSLSNTSADLFTFSGLLTIGTLGIAGLAASEDDDYSDVDVVDANNNDATTEEHDDTDGAVTPTFTYTPPPPEVAGVEKAAVALEAIAEKDDDSTTEDDLMVVSAELEKVLCGRNSSAAGDSVTSARASFATGGVDFPLQGFLFGSPVSDAESRQDRRDSAGGGGRRTSLGELFLRTRFADEKMTLVAVEEAEDGKADREEGGAGKGGGGGKMTNRKLKDEKYAGGASASKSKFQKVCESLLTFLSRLYLSKTYNLW